MFLFTIAPSFEHLRTINGQVINTYRDGCSEIQLLEDDNQWD